MDNREYTKKFRDWILHYSFDLSATYTFKKPIEAAVADKFMQNYFNKIDRNLYGNAACRYNKRVQRLNVTETGVALQKSSLLLEQTDGRVHVHSSILMPTDRFTDLHEFSNYLEIKWYENSHIAGNVEFKKIYSQNWLFYMTKKISASDCDSILINSSYIAQTQTF